MKRHNQFKDVRGLDAELNSIIRQTEERLGKIVNNLPPLNQAAEGATFFIKQSDGSWKRFTKLEGAFVEI